MKRLIHRIILTVFFSVVISAGYAEMIIDGLRLERTGTAHGYYARVLGTTSKDITSVNLSRKYKWTADEQYSIIEIGDAAFKDCKYLKDIHFPTGLKTIGLRAFEGCVSLENVELPGQINYWRQDIFKNCINLKSVKINYDFSYFQLLYGGNYLTMNTILPSMFSGCVNLQYIYMARWTPGERTFKGLKTKWLTVYFNVPDYCFEECDELRSVTISSSGGKVGKAAFRNCAKLERVTLKTGPLSDSIFDQCPNLKDIYCLNNTPGTTSDKTFTKENYHATLHVPKGSKNAYLNADHWKEFFNIVEEDLSGIKTPVVSQQETDAPYYDLEGREVLQPEKGRIYIHGGRKVLVK